MGQRLDDPPGWLVRKSLSNQGPVASYRVLGPPDAPPPRQATAQVLQDPALWESAIQRSVALAQLQNQHLCGVLGMGRLADGRPYRVDRPVDGVTAEAFLSQHGPLDPDKTLHILTRLANVVGELHARGVVHGHIHLSAIWFLNNDPMKPILGGIPITHAGEWLPHAPPEVQNGAGTDLRSDIFGLGYITVSLLRGAPADGAGHDPSWRKLTPGPVFAIPSHAPLAPGLAALLEQMIDRDPDRRPSSAHAIASTVGQVIHPGQPLAPASSPNNTRVLGMGLGALLLVTIVIVAAVGALRPSDPASAKQSMITDQPAPVVEAPIEINPAPIEPTPAEAPPPEPPSPDANPNDGGVDADPYANPAALSGNWQGQNASGIHFDLDVIFFSGRVNGEATVWSNQESEGDRQTHKVTGTYQLGNGAGEVSLEVHSDPPSLLDGVFVGPAIGGTWRQGESTHKWEATLQASEQ